jgi:hypothetical protein
VAFVVATADAELDSLSQWQGHQTIKPSQFASNGRCTRRLSAVLNGAIGLQRLPHRLERCRSIS